MKKKGFPHWRARKFNTSGKYVPSRNNCSSIWIFSGTSLSSSGLSDKYPTNERGQLKKKTKIDFIREILMINVSYLFWTSTSFQTSVFPSPRSNLWKQHWLNQWKSSTECIIRVLSRHWVQNIASFKLWE